jgi:hypothetical protein
VNGLTCVSAGLGENMCGLKRAREWADDVGGKTYDAALHIR